MTVDEVGTRVEAIVAGSNGPDQHMAEDDLHRDVLAAIAAGAPEPEALAAEALKTSTVKFDRWFD